MDTRIPAIPKPGTLPAVVAVTRFCVTSRTSAREGLTFKGEMEMVSTASSAGLGCVRGTAMALSLEALMTLGAYSVWHMLHLIH